MGGELAIFDVDDARTQREISELRKENRALSEALQRANAETEQARRVAVNALTALRRQLTPLYRALQSVFGELDAAGTTESSDTASAPTNASASQRVWANWKERMPGAPAKVIDALLLHKDMNQQQLCIATGVPRGSMTNVISRLNKAGLIAKNGGRISLKAL